MMNLMSEVKFLTARDDINIKDTDFGAFKYIEKNATTSSNTYSEGKQEYANFRNHDYLLHGRKSKQLKDSIKKLEDALKNFRVVHCAWTDVAIITMLLSNGLLLHIYINIFSGGINRIAFDKFFIGKLISETVISVVMTRMHILISYDINQLTFVHLQKSNLKKNSPEKLSRMDPKIFNIIISGTHTKKIGRHLACNSSCDLLAVWTQSSQNEVYPWRPTVRDQDRANIHVYKLSRNKLDLLSFHWTENDPISVEFSKVHQNQLRSVEQKMSRKGEVNIEICMYEVNKTKMHRISTTSIPLQSQVCCHSFSPDNEKLMLGCIDASVVLFDEGRGITHLIKAAFIPTLVSWHADSAIVTIANEKSQIQFFDLSLSCIRNQILNEELTLDIGNYFTTQPLLLQICCSEKSESVQYNENYIQCDSYILLLFENGPITILRLLGGNGQKGDFHTSGFTADVLIQQYLKLNNVERAINVLLCLNWDVYGDILIISLQKIANHIFRKPFQIDREAQLTKALGSFLIPVKPLCEDTQIEFGDQVRDITRKFFQYLLRNKSYEKAFNLAIDIDDEDIFMDLSNCAKDVGHMELAHDALCKADSIIARSDSRQSSHSTCSRDSCSRCATNSFADDEAETWTEAHVKNKNKKDIQTENVPHTHRTIRFNKNLKNFSIPKLELKVSNYSKCTIQSSSGQVNLNMKNGKEMLNYSTVESGISGTKNEVDFNVHPLKATTTSRFSILNMNHLNLANFCTDSLKYQKSIFGRIQENGSRATKIINRHHVVDVVPKSPLEWNVSIPDQTIGIPVSNTTSIHPRNRLNHSADLTSITHHPLVSGHIPPAFTTVGKRMRIPSETIHVNSSNVYSSILSQQQAHNIDKEHGEKNKVKFSNTVTVAVVPDIQRKEKHQTYDDNTSSKSSNSLTWI